MERLHKIAVGILGAMILWAYSSIALCADYCSLKVRVMTPEGLRPDALISVEERSGRTVTQYQESTDVSFCDLGGLPVTVRVGAAGTCNQVVVRNVPVEWNSTYLLKVTYDVETCLRETAPSPVPTCRVVLRIADSQGRWISGASVHLRSPRDISFQADGYGRASFVVRTIDAIEGEVTKNRFGVYKFAFACTDSEPIREEQILLRKTSPAEAAAEFQGRSFREFQ